ncbi:glycosyltransferase [Escherichia coli]|uniref:glycosyltransferase family 2 protein n=1 Tax=Enterobacterales TaxID=91347 RepID=UPI00128EC8A2|nr:MULTISPECIES: glycosyltransferase [Enterobacterales]MQK50363.1 glycosyltransferase [Escherichia coli]QFV07561.1 glycosyltransferase [Proteus mirabilis]HAW2772904.1 glycosyltransferase [Escherichia coli]
MTIEIAISTLNDGIEKIKLNPKFNYIIIHQISNQKNYSTIVNKLSSSKVKYIPSKTIGLSKSRNLALENSNADYIWIMDDDVIIDDNAYDNLQSIIYSNLNFDMLVLSHTTLENPNNRNITTNFSRINSFQAMSVSSIDMFIKRASVIDKKIAFDEQFGLGSKYPSGEEYLFTIQCLKSGLKILKTNQIFSYHPPVASGHDFFTTPNKLKAKLYMFRNVYGNYFGTFIYFIFILKKIHILVPNRKLLQAIKICFTHENK